MYFLFHGTDSFPTINNVGKLFLWIKIAQFISPGFMLVISLLSHPFSFKLTDGMNRLIRKKRNVFYIRRILFGLK